MVIGSIASPLVGLALRIERGLLIRQDSLGATYVNRLFQINDPVCALSRILMMKQCVILTGNGTRLGRRYI